MMKNDQEIGKGIGHPDNASTGSINAIVNLRKGDVVLLRNLVGVRDETIHGNKMVGICWISVINKLNQSVFCFCCKC